MADSPLFNIDNSIDDMKAASIYIDNNATSSLLNPSALKDVMFGKSENFFSYLDVLSQRDLFRRSGGKSQIGLDGVGIDNPIVLYFKLFFYFDDISFSNNSIGAFSNNGLLSRIISTRFNNNDPNNSRFIYSNYANSAINYLLLNNEINRAQMLEKFITLLSNISKNTPWYFSTISGLKEALERKTINDGLKIEEERKKISIDCLDDSVDQRIGTLLDLYRGAVYSQILNKVIVPANLRKFNMGIFIFSSPIQNLHFSYIPNNSNNYISYPSFIPNNSNDMNIVGHKYIELQNCEIDYNSSTTAFELLDNKEGIRAHYKIDISFDNVYESRYNEFLCQILGDFVANDYMNSYNLNELSAEQQQKAKENIERRLNNFFEIPEKNENTSEGTAVRNDKLDKSKSEQNQSNKETEQKRQAELKAKGKENGLKKITDFANDLKNDAINKYKKAKDRVKNLPKNALNQVQEIGISKLKSAVNSILLGNIYEDSVIQKIRNVSDQLTNGNIIGLGQTIINEIKEKNNSTAGDILNSGKKLTGYAEIQTQTGKKITVKKIYDEPESQNDNVNYNIYID